MQRDLELEYDEIIFGLNLDSLRFSYAKNIPIFYTLNGISAPPIYDFVDPKIKRDEFDDLQSRVALLGLTPARAGQSARIEDGNTLKLVTLGNLIIKIKFNKLWLTNTGAAELEESLPESEFVDLIHFVADPISVRSGLYHDYWELETDGNDFVKKIVFKLSDRFFYKNIDNKKDCVALSYIKDEDLDKLEFSEVASRMKTAYYMKKAGIKGRWDNTNGYFKPIKLESVCRIVYPQYKLKFKDLPSHIEMLYDVPAPQLKDDLYGEIKKIPVQQN
jgi:hypothetical protein